MLDTSYHRQRLSAQQHGMPPPVFVVLDRKISPIAHPERHPVVQFNVHYRYRLRYLCHVIIPRH
ncbi:hypothetical protein [Sphingomonas sp. PAMC 26621]|uniref:hypothetical protein n=1 Tax=Sphingomonas sp. PAMC 26621 TaxID=1112213 RepID=UPI001111133E|nr:hypothetical protein [Sphingomonas sp. PAMC 26621]